MSGVAETEESKELSFDDPEIRAGFRRMVGQCAVAAVVVALLIAQWDRDEGDVPLLAAKTMFVAYATWFFAYAARRISGRRLPDDPIGIFPSTVRHVLGFSLIAIYGVLVAAGVTAVIAGLIALAGNDYMIGLRAALSLIILVPIGFATLRALIDIASLFAPRIG